MVQSIHTCGVVNVQRCLNKCQHTLLVVSTTAHPSVIRRWIKRGREFQSAMSLMCFEVLHHASVGVYVFVCECLYVDVCLLAHARDDCVWRNNPSSCWATYGSRVDWYVSVFVPLLCVCLRRAPNPSEALCPHHIHRNPTAQCFLTNGSQSIRTRNLNTRSHWVGLEHHQINVF